MNCLLLAGGFATRMYPVTMDTPKALLKIKNKEILSYIVEDLCSDPRIQMIFLVSSHRYLEQFYEWRRKTGNDGRVTILNNGADSAEENAGAAANILSSIKLLGLPDELLIMGTDNLLSFSIREFISFYLRGKKSCVMWHEEHDPVRLSRTGVALIEDGFIAQMTEKPKFPLWTCAIPPIYMYTREALELICTLRTEVFSMDSTGSLLERLVPKLKIAAMEMPGVRFHVGDLETYHALKEKSELLLYGKVISGNG